MQRTIPGLIITLSLLVLLCSPEPTMGGPTKTRAVRQDAELVVNTAALGLGGLLQKVAEREDQILMLRDFIQPIRFFPDGSGYFFVFDMDGICIAHGAQPNLEGNNMLEFKDVKGFQVIKTMIEKSQTGGGYIEYNWEKPGSDGFFMKLGYVAPIPGTDFLLGSGVYFPEPW
ncbi:cache domain-containing protein [Pseudodesulfovibrio sp.]|nr:cache domain-containing protein [Pseudodesulfovibrio sp.]